MGLFGSKKPKQREVSAASRRRISRQRGRPSRHQIRTLWRNAAHSGPVTVDGDLLEDLLGWMMFYEMVTPDYDVLGFNDVWTDIDANGEWDQFQNDANGVVETTVEVSEATASEVEQIEQALDAEVVTAADPAEETTYEPPQTSTPMYDSPSSYEPPAEDTTKNYGGGGGYSSAGYGDSYDSGGGGYDSGGGGGCDD